MYSVGAFGKMLLDEHRREAYTESIRACMSEGARVLDLGCGTGYFTMQALSFGAGHVDAVDMSPVVRRLPQVIKENGYEDRCSVYEGRIQEMRLEPYDLIISDLRGTVPLFSGHLETLRYVHTNLTHQGTVVLPLRDCLRMALVNFPRERSIRQDPWNLDGHGYSSYECSERTRAESSHSQDYDLMSNEVTWETIDYSSSADLERTQFGGTSEIVVSRDGYIDGILVWFDATISPGVSYSTDRTRTDSTYGRRFLPFYDQFEVEEGARLAVSLEALRSGSEYVWRWGVQGDDVDQDHSSLDQDETSLLRLPTYPLDADRLRNDMDMMGRLLEAGNLDRAQAGEGLSPEQSDVLESLAERYTSTKPRRHL